MKVLHINTYQGAGAALCAIRINKALVQKGIECKMLFADGDTMPEGVEGDIAELDNSFIDSVDILRKIKRIPTLLPSIWDEKKMRFALNRANTSNLFISQPLTKYQNIAHHPYVKWADIIHLHWTGRFIDYPTFFKEVRKPMVWTLHDKNPAIGLMHFESQFSVLPKELDKLDTICRKIKKESLSHAYKMHTVAISSMMKDTILASEILNPFPVTLIHNGVDTELFYPRHDEKSIVDDFVKSLRQDTIIFTFSSLYIWDGRKGLDRVLPALEKIIDKTGKSIALIVIGEFNANDKQPETTFPVFCTGLLDDQLEIARVYSVSNFFINASYEEGFAQTPLEAMACGVPVISTPCSGAKDLINSINGVVCDGFEPKDLFIGIQNAIEKCYDSEKIVEYINNNFSYSKIASEYIKLYKKML